MTRLLPILLAAVSAFAQQRELKPGFNLFSRDQDIQMGKEAANEVERTLPVVRNEQLAGYISRIGGRLAKSKHAGNWPYKFQVVYDKSVNAFALPGGPMFVHTGLLGVVENEGQLAGVLAHEMSHVTLRHGTNQVSKANFIQLAAMLGGVALGNNMWGQLGRLGVSLGANSVLLKYSRNAERDADLNGMRMMADAGYNPIEMAHFFEKLEAKAGKDNALTRFLSDHPSPGNRVKAVEEEIRYLPQRGYDGGSPDDLRRARETAANLPAPRNLRPESAQAGHVPDIRPSSRFRRFQGRAFSISYPDNWQALGDQQSAMLTLAPPDAFVKDQSGHPQLGYGAIVSFYFPEGDSIDPRRDTDRLIAQLQRDSPGIRRGGEAQRSIRVGGQSGLLTTLQSTSPYINETEVDVLVTVPRSEGLFYIIFVSPRSEYKDVEAVFENMVASVQFNH